MLQGELPLQVLTISYVYLSLLLLGNKMTESFLGLFLHWAMDHHFRSMEIDGVSLLKHRIVGLVEGRVPYANLGNRGLASCGVLYS